jgi:hypothetical protein
VNDCKLRVLRWVDKEHPRFADTRDVAEEDVHGFLVAFGALVDGGQIARDGRLVYYVTPIGLAVMENHDADGG